MIEYLFVGSRVVVEFSPGSVVPSKIVVEV